MIDLFCLTDEQLSTCIDRLSERINTLQDCKNVMDRTKTYTPHLLNPDEYESLKKNLNTFYVLLHKFLIQWLKRNNPKEAYIDFTGGGSHRVIEKQKRILDKNKIVRQTLPYGYTQYLKTRIRVHAYYVDKMIGLGFSKSRRK